MAVSSPDLKAFLVATPFFGGLSDASLDLLISMLVERRFEVGATVVAEGEPGRSMYIVQSGGLVVSKLGASGCAIHMTCLGPGDFFGEMTLIEMQNRSATVVAESPTVLYELTARNLYTYYKADIYAYAMVMQNINRELCRRLRRADNRIAELADASRDSMTRQASRRKPDMTHEYRATVEWKRQGVAFVDNRYSRGHVWRFDGGVEVPASSAPSSVPLPYSVAAAVDPEEALVAAVSSCHMLFFLSIAAKQGFMIDRYLDEAIGSMARNDRDKLYVSKIVLSPDVTFCGSKQPSEHELDALHHRAHEECYIANSVKAEIIVRPKRPDQA